MARIKITDLKDLCIKALTKAGMSDNDAHVTTDHFLSNELSGKTSHGVVRVVQAVKVIDHFGAPTDSFVIEREKGNSLVIDGKMNIGPVVAREITLQAIKRAKEHGLAFCGMHSTIVNTGSMAFYLRLMADKNIIGLMSCNSQRLVAPPKGREKMLGTNPMGISIPSADGNHFIADFATSAIAYGKVLVAQDKGEELPEGMIIDKEGNPSTAPNDAAGDGAILPLADYRGFALGLFIELMATLAGGTPAKDDWYGKDGMFIIAIDPNHIAGENFAKQVEGLLNTIRNSAPAPGHHSVTIPGDRSAEKLKRSLELGVVDVTNKTLNNLKELAA